MVRKEMILSTLLGCVLTLPTFINAQNCRDNVRNKTIDINEDCHGSDCASSFCRNISNNSSCVSPVKVTISDDMRKVAKFRAKFGTNCDYDHNNNNQGDWNKLMKIGELAPHTNRTSIRMGWRWRFPGDPVSPPVSQSGMELALYAHIDNKFNSVSLKKFVGLGSGNSFKGELVFSNEGGVFVMAEERGYAIRRELFTDTRDVGIWKNAFFGGQETAPHDMDIEVSSMDFDCTPQWSNTDHKPFGRSEFYDGEDVTVFASKTIKAPVPVFVEDDGFKSSTTIKDGADVEFKAGEKIVLKGGFHAKSGSEFRAVITGSGNNDDVYRKKGSSPETSPSLYGGNVNNDTSGTISTHSSSGENKETSPLNSSRNQFTVYPNPTKDQFKIQVPSTDINTAYTVTITDVIGRVIYHKNDLNKHVVHIDIRDYSAGVYFVKVIQNETVYKEKLMKQ